MFSFNSPFGKCDECDGLGTLMEIDEDLIIPDKSKSILEGAILTLGDGSLKDDSWTRAILEALAKKGGFTLDTPIEKLSEENLNAILYGTNGNQLRLHKKRSGRVHE
jgi:excinuclease ABC subunit A